MASLADRDESIEIGEGDYVVAGTVAPALPRRRTLPLATLAFAVGFVATAILGLAAALLG